LKDGFRGVEKGIGGLEADAGFQGGRAVDLRGAGPTASDICDSDQIGRILKSDQSGRSFNVPPFQGTNGVRRVSALTDLQIGETAILEALDLPDSVQNYLMHMGFVPDAVVTALRRAPAGDPTVYSVDGMEIALRRETAKAIRVRSVADARMSGPFDPKSGEIRELAEAIR
jgi:ferrous iron transport protein A